MAKSIESQRLPYVSFATWTGLLDRLRAGELPSHIDTSYLAPLSFSGSTSSSLRTALRFLGLITDAGVPTDKLRQLLAAQGKDRETLCRKLLYESYPSLIDLGRATPQELREYLKKQGASGDSTRKCEAFLLALAGDANVPTPHLRPMGTRRRPARRPFGGRKTSEEKAQQLQFPDPPPPPNGQNAAMPLAQHHNIAWLELFLKKYPEFDHAHPESHEQWHLGFQSMFQIIAELHRQPGDSKDGAAPAT